jgi:class 3 adenylate cyclase
MPSDERSLQSRINALAGMLFPTSRIRPHWRTIWAQAESERYTVSARVATSLAILCYLAHILYIDVVLNFTPRPKWIALRSVGIVANLVPLLLTFSRRFSHQRGYKIPLMIAGFVCTYLQHVSYLWWPRTGFIFAIVIPSITVTALRLSPAATVAYVCGCYGMMLPEWLVRDELFGHIISTASVALVLTVSMRSRQSIEVSAFLSEQANLESQKKLIEREMELNAQIKAFLPKEIYRRFLKIVEEGTSPNQAMLRLLDRRKTHVACLYTDIRSFTQMAKNDGFVAGVAIPNITACTDVVEKHGGIPKLVGDLVFAYFDGPAHQNLLNAVLCAIALQDMSDRLAADSPAEQRIQRYTLISAGEAIVGNIGGNESAREINVLGSPANILSRIDPLTKIPAFKTALGESKTILTRAAANLLGGLCPLIQVKEIRLQRLGIAVRDFEEETLLFGLNRDPRTVEILRARLSGAYVDPQSGAEFAAKVLGGAA